MSIMLEPCAQSASLTVTGDISAQLTIPADPGFAFGGEAYLHAYYVTLSDGTLLKAVRHADPCWEVIIEGASSIERSGDGKALHIHWDVEWITLASICNASAVAQRDVHGLPLFRPEPDTRSAVA